MNRNQRLGKYGRKITQIVFSSCFLLFSDWLMLENQFNSLLSETDSFTVVSVRPGLFFTPNNDGWNDYFEVVCTNPYDGNVSGRIYDLNGQTVSGMKKQETIEGSYVLLRWDGRDSSGKFIPGGIYFYQVEITGPENKMSNGLIILVR